jgi:hypothetical protein
MYQPHHDYAEEWEYVCHCAGKGNAQKRDDDPEAFLAPAVGD